MIENKNYYIDQINSSKAFKITSYYHYSHQGFRKAILNLGIFRKSDNKLVGASQWGCSFQDAIRLDKYVKEPIGKKEYLELNRFCMADSEGANAESQGISLSIKWIKQYRPNIKLLVSYSGRKEGNYGYIYQATNWEYLGYFISKGFWEIDGQEKHSMSLWYSFSKNQQGKETFYDFLNRYYNTVIQTWTKQFIYIQRLDDTLTPAVEPLLYPKISTDFPIKEKEKIYKNEEYETQENNLIEPVFYYEKEKYLFSKATLKRRGELVEDQRQVAIYDGSGIYEQSFANLKAIPQDLYARASVKKVLDKEVSYKKKYFRYYNKEEEPLEMIDIPFVCIIDEIAFSTLVDAAQYLGVSKQAVQQSKSRLGKKIAGKEIIWGD